MAIDARIVLAGQPAQIDRPSNALLRALAVQRGENQNLEFQQEQEDRARALADENQLRTILAGGGGEPELMKAGLYKPAMAVGKNARENERISAEANAKKFEVFKGKLGLSLQQLGAVQSPEQAQQWYASQVKDGLMPMQTATEHMRQLPTDPQAFAQWRDGMIRTGATAIQQLEQRVREQNLGLTEARNEETGRHNLATEENNRLMRLLQRDRLAKEHGPGATQIVQANDAEGNPQFFRVPKTGPEGPIQGMTPRARREPEDVQGGIDYSREFGNDPLLRPDNAPGPAEYADAAKSFAKDPDMKGSTRGRWVSDRGFEVKRNGKVVGYYK